MADFRLFWVETGYPLPCATLFSNFSTAKKLQKPFAAQSPPRKRGFLSTHQTIVGKTSALLRNSLSSLADAPHCSMGLVSKYRLVNIMSNSYAMSRCGLRKLYFRYTSVDFYCYFTVNRTNLSDQLAYGKMTLLNFSFMFRWCKVKS